MASITFDGEASESFANLLQHIAGYTVEVVPEEGISGYAPGGAPFDAVVVGSAADETEDYFGVLVRAFDEKLGEPTGDPFAVIVRELRVY